jgi:hypothetical protein
VSPSRSLQSSTVTFALNELIELEPFVDAVGRILEAHEQAQLAVLDFSQLQVPTARRIRPFNLLLLANVLAASADQSHVRLVLPRDDHARLLVLRSGLLFSLAIRRAPVDALSMDGFRDAAAATQWLEMWEQPWSPVQPTLGRLFEDEPRPVDDRTVLANPNNAKRATRIVVDPHLLARDALLHHASQGLAGAWLGSVTPDSHDERRREARTVWQGLVTSRVLGEPLINLPDHATTRPVGVPALGRSVRSLVLLARTDGGGGDSHPRLHLVVADTGYGLVSTLRPALSRPTASPEERAVAQQTSVEILRFALTRPARTVNDPGLPWARDTFSVAVSKAGIDRAADIEFTVVTGDGSSDNNAIWVTVPASGRADDVTSGVVSGVPFIGTTVFACLPMPHNVEGDTVNS